MKKLKKALERAIRNTPKDPILLSRLAKVYIENNEFTKAEKILEDILAFNPNFFESWYYLGLTYWKMNEFEKVSEILKNQDYKNSFIPQKIKCPQCNKKFKAQSDLDQHFKTEHIHKKVNCPQCSEKFKAQSDLDHHLKAVHFSKKVKCPQCREKFKAQSDLDHHLKTVHKFKPFKCPNCGKMINSIEEFKQHDEYIEHENHVKKQFLYNKVRKDKNHRYLKCDLHNLELQEAKSEILFCLDECTILDKREIEIIHGYKHGHVLKDYIESNRFINEIAENGIKLEILEKYNKLGSKRFSIKYIN